MYKKYIKRILDVILSGFAIIVLSPILIITAVAIKLSSPGPVLFRSIRVGKDRKPFDFYKFRSMHVVDERHQQKKLYIADQDRLFLVGKIVRRLKLDELPQLLNILQGHMSIIGPRPMPQSSVDEVYYGKYAPVTTIRPGLSSFASLYDTVIGDTYTDDVLYQKEVLPIKQELELLYLKKESFFTDFRLVLETMLVVVLSFVGKATFRYKKELAEVM